MSKTLDANATLDDSQMRLDGEILAERQHPLISYLLICNKTQEESQWSHNVGNR